MQNDLMRYIGDKSIGQTEEDRKMRLQTGLEMYKTLPQLLAAMRESKSQSESSGSQYGGLMDLLLAGYR